MTPRQVTRSPSERQAPQLTVNELRAPCPRGPLPSDGMTEPAPPPRRPGTPLIDRPSTSTPGSPAPEGNSPRVIAPGRRHVWIAPVDPSNGQAPHPGLIHAWRRDDQGWWARCTYIVDDGTPEGVMVTQWVAAQAVRPA